MISFPSSRNKSGVCGIPIHFKHLLIRKIRTQRAIDKNLNYKVNILYIPSSTAITKGRSQRYTNNKPRRVISLQFQQNYYY